MKNFLIKHWNTSFCDKITHSAICQVLTSEADFYLDWFHLGIPQPLTIYLYTIWLTHPND